MGHFNNDVITLIRNIVNKNKINSCNKDYHECYEIATSLDHTNIECYHIKQSYKFFVFNYRNLSHINFNIYKIRTTCFAAKLPKNY